MRIASSHNHQPVDSADARAIELPLDTAPTSTATAIDKSSTTPAASGASEPDTSGGVSNGHSNAVNDNTTGGANDTVKLGTVMRQSGKTVSVAPKISKGTKTNIDTTDSINGHGEIIAPLIPAGQQAILNKIDKAVNKGLDIVNSVLEGKRDATKSQLFAARMALSLVPILADSRTPDKQSYHVHFSIPRPKDKPTDTD